MLETNDFELRGRSAIFVNEGRMNVKNDLIYTGFNFVNEGEIKILGNFKTEQSDNKNLMTNYGSIEIGNDFNYIGSNVFNYGNIKVVNNFNYEGKNFFNGGTITMKVLNIQADKVENLKILHAKEKVSIRSIDLNNIGIINTKYLTLSIKQPIVEMGLIRAEEIIELPY